MEGLLLLLVALAPWCFGAVHPSFELVLLGGLAFMLLLWAGRTLLQGRLVWQHCPVALCLAALFVTAVWQIVPLSGSWLTWVSPPTAEVYRLFLPAPREAVPPAYAAMRLIPGSGSTISLCPGVTQREAIRLLAVLLLFALVRSNLTGAAQLRRLSLVAFVNGAFLSLFALVQFFSWGPSNIYGVYPTEGAAFGPFICRNHFPYYVNLCLGCGLGLLLTFLAGATRKKQRSCPHPERKEANGSTRSGRRSSSGGKPWKVTTYALPAGDSGEGGVASVFNKLIQQPALLALVFALVLMAAAILFSASRGGGLALLGALLGVFLLQVRRSASFFKVSAVALFITLPVIVLLTWFGLDRLEDRWEKLFDVGTASVEQLTSESAKRKALEAGQIDRIHLWACNWPAFREFPLWGTGYGTFEFTELLHRDKVEQEGLLYEHAHNDYLEVLLEGGISGLLPVLLTVGLLLWFGYRALRRQRESSAGWLATGLLFGLLTLILHSFVDFGLHIPAITFLATVLCAHLCALGCRKERGSEDSGTPSEARREGGTAVRWALPLPAALLLVLFAVLLVNSGWKRHKASRFLDAAARLVEGIDHPDRLQQIAYLQAAVREEPRAPHLRLELARAEMALYRQEELQEKSRATLLALTQEVTVGGGVAPSGLLPSLSGAATMVATYQDILTRERSRREELLMPALASYLATRDLCPILAEPHVRIAAYADKLPGAQEASVYLERATLLAPVNPTVWYLCGRQQLLDNHQEAAWQSWQRSLALSEIHLPSILKLGREKLSEEEIREKVLPDKARILYAAALYLHPEEADLEERRPFLDRALAVLAELPQPLEAEDLAVRAAIQESLGDKKEALASYQAALNRAPQEITLRLSYARLLYEEGQLRDAARNLETILAQKPGHAEAKELLAQVRRDMARKL